MTLEDIESHILSALQRNTDAVVAADLQAARLGLQAIMAQRINRPANETGADGATFQARVQPWMLACFGAEISADVLERNHRFFEEAGELVQACGMTREEAHALVDYTWSRPVGEKDQEVGGVMVTLAALCLANGLGMHAAGETELARINMPETIEKIRAKQAAKPKHSPLPEASRSPAMAPEVSGECFIVIGYGESDIPEAKIVTRREDLPDAVLGMIYWPASDAPADVRAQYAQDLADEDEWAADQWSVSFEIGGIHVWRVELHPFTPVSAMAAEAVAYACLTPSGKVAYFDGKPMLSTVQNECFPIPLYIHPEPVAAQPSADDCPKCGAHRRSGSFCGPDKQPCPFDEPKAYAASVAAQPSAIERFINREPAQASELTRELARKALEARDNDTRTDEQKINDAADFICDTRLDLPVTMAQPSAEVTGEQYRMQMAGISTAALGYWKEGDEIHPDYDTLALRDVAKLYAKYAAFREALANLAACVGMLMPNCQWTAHKDARALLDPLTEIARSGDKP